MGWLNSRVPKIPGVEIKVEDVDGVVRLLHSNNRSRGGRLASACRLSIIREQPIHCRLVSVCYDVLRRKEYIRAVRRQIAKRDRAHERTVVSLRSDVLKMCCDLRRPVRLGTIQIGIGRVFKRVVWQRGACERQCEREKGGGKHIWKGAERIGDVRGIVVAVNAFLYVQR